MEHIVAGRQQTALTAGAVAEAASNFRKKVEKREKEKRGEVGII
jgi:hypothetical protein